jgi:capsular exopolysaccharide synthesis family protein
MSPLQQSFTIILRYRGIVLLVVAVTLLSAIFFAFLTAPVYQATATIHIQQQSRELKEQFDQVFDIQQQKLNTELQILSSRTLAEAAVARTGYQLQLVRPYNGLAALYGAVTSRLRASYNILATMGSQLTSLLRWHVTMPTLSFPPLSRQPAINLQHIKIIGDVPAPVLYTIRFLQEGAFVVQKVEDGQVVGKGRVGVPFQSALFSFVLESEKVQAGDEVQLRVLPLSEAANQFQGGIKVALITGTEIARCTAEAETPELARVMATSLAQEYIAFNQRRKAQEAAQAIGFIEQQLQTTQKALLASEQDLSRFKKRQRFVELGSEAMANVTKLTQTETALRRLQTSLHAAEDLRRRLQSSRQEETKDIYKLGSGVGSPLLESLAKSLSDFQINHEALSLKFGPKHPRRLEVEEQMAQVKQEMQQELAALITAYRGEESSLQQIMQEYYGRIEQLPQAERELAQLTRQARVDEEIHGFLARKQKEMQVVQASGLDSVRTVDLPLPPKSPTKPNKKKVVLVAAMLSLMLGVGTAFVLDHFDPSLKTLEEAERHLQLHLLGVIPEVSARSRNKRALAQRAAAAEGYRSLRTSLRLVTNGNTPGKTLAIVSPQAGDGKSTITANLALCLGSLGYKTLLIDADLRKPTQHRLFATPRAPGLAELLQGELWTSDIIHRVGEKLHLLSAGAPQTNASELLDSRRLQELIGIWRQSYDYVLFDVPAMLAVTDPVVVGTQCQGCLLIVRTGVTSIKSTQRALGLLKAAHIPILGVVINGLMTLKEYGYDYYAYTDASASQRTVQKRAKPKIIPSSTHPSA